MPFNSGKCMFKNSFAKYARAVCDEGERRGLYRLFCIKQIARLILLILSVIVLAELLILGDAISAEDSYAIIIFGVTLIVWFAVAIATVVFWLVFRSVYNGILKRPVSQNEPPEVAEYRQKTLQNNEKSAGKSRICAALLILGFVALVGFIAADVALHPDTDDMGYFSLIGIIIFGACVLAYLFVRIYAESKRQKFEKQSDDEAAQIDSLQGREHVYSLQNDKNTDSIFYLIPNPVLRERCERERSKYGKIVVISAIISALVAAVIIAVVFSGLVFDFNISGYATPFFIFMAFAAASLSGIGCQRRISVIEKQQREEFLTNPEYAKNAQIYAMYENYGKLKGKTILICTVASLIISLILGILFPTEPWSLLTLILIIAGIILQNKFLSDLRKSVIPIEREIDTELSAKQAALSSNDDIFTIDNPALTRLKNDTKNN